MTEVVDELTEDDITGSTNNTGASANYLLPWEDAHNLSTLHRIRLDIQRSVLEQTKRKHVRNKLLYMKQSHMKKFSVGEQVYFKINPDWACFCCHCTREGGKGSPWRFVHCVLQCE